MAIDLATAALAIPTMLAQKAACAEVPTPVVSRAAKPAPARADSPFATVSDLIHWVEPAVVQIETRTAVGSGFVLDPAGLIVTWFEPAASP